MSLHFLLGLFFIMLIRKKDPTERVNIVQIFSEKRFSQEF